MITSQEVAFSVSNGYGTHSCAQGESDEDLSAIKRIAGMHSLISRDL